jgi:tRNA-modifying protein YgfZ
MTTTEHLSAAVAAQYEAAMTSVALLDAAMEGRLRLTDRDRADLLHRLSTNDIRSLTPGDGTRTVLVNHHARIIDLLSIYALPEHLLVTTSAGQSGAVSTLLRKNIFFQDRVGVEDITADTVQYNLYGPMAAALVRTASSLDPVDWPLHHIQAVEIDGAQGWLARILPIAGNGFALIGRADDRETLRAALADAVELDPATFNVLRVEQGYPAFGSELSLEYIPLETRLTDAVSFHKGCYVGQEIIARMESRNRLAKQLMGLRLGRLVPAGGNLLRQGKEMGDLTSAVDSPRFGPIGLAYVRSAVAEPGTELEVADGVRAEVVELPFA